MPPAIETFALTKYFPATQGWKALFSRQQSPHPAVDRISLSIATGEMFGLVGPNGAGKTTLIKLISTLVLPTSGAARINGYNLQDDLGIKKSIGLVTSDERSFYWRLTGKQNLAFFAALQGLNSQQTRERIALVVSQMGLEDIMDQRFQTYSTGIRQRFSIARALLHDPLILILDEPTKGLDPHATLHLYQFIQERLLCQQGMTVLLTTHSLQDVEKFCDRVAVMHKGSLRGCGSIAELRQEAGIAERFTIHIRHENPSLAQALAQMLPSLTITEESPQETRLEFDPLQEGHTLQNVIGAIEGHGGAILDFSQKSASLADVFEQLTQTENPPHLNPPPASTAALPPPESPPVLTRTYSLNWLRVALAFLRRDLSEEISYRVSFFLQLFSILVSAAVYYFIAILIGPSAQPYLEPYGGDYFAFVLIGVAFSGYFGVGLSGFSRSLRQAQTTGTLEAMLSTPTPISAIIVASSLWSYTITTLRVIVYLALGVGFLGLNLQGGNFLGALLVLLLTILAFSGIGILAASFIMVLKRGDPVTWVVEYLATLLGGVYYPISILPAWLQVLSALLPITYSLEAMRKILIQGASLSSLKVELLVLSLFAIVLLPLGINAFRFAVRRARQDGSLTHY